MKKMNFSFVHHWCAVFSKGKVWILLLFLFVPLSFYAQITITEPGCGTTGSPDSGNHSATCSTSLIDFNTHHNDDMVPQGITRTLKVKTNVVLMQRQGGSGNFSPSTNPEHKEFFDNTFVRMNALLTSLEQDNCDCTITPLHYENIHIEFVPNYIEIQDEFHWNHLNDPASWYWNSGNKVFLNGIHDLLIAEGHEPAFDIFVTTNRNSHDYLMDPVNGVYAPQLFPDGYNGQWYSALPKNDLAAPAFWHCPNLYLEWYDNRYNRGDFWEDYIRLYEKIAAKGFIHEYGHYIGGLKHKNHCPDNIMKGNSVLTRKAFTGCQVRDIYRTIMSATNMRKFVVCEDVLDSTHEFIIDSDEEWTNDLRVYTNIRIKPEATLTVSCKLYLQPKAKITVEKGARLIIAEDAFVANGGVCEDEPDFLWDGVHVFGNPAIPHKTQYAFDWYTLTADDHGIVLIHPGSTIQDAEVGIDCIHRYTDDGATHPIYTRDGAYVRADGANFINNTKGINFTPFSFDSKSEVLNCIFEGGDIGIANRECNDVKVLSSEFNDQTINGIYASHAGMQVQNNAFNRIDDAIEINNVLLINHPFIVDHNEFVGNGVGVKASLANNLLVSNNDFTVGKFGVSLMGQGQAVIQNNKFEDVTAGVDLQSVGDDYIPVGCNTFKECSFGMNPSGDNRGLQYFYNQNLEDNIFDAYIESDGDGNQAVLRNQGDGIEPVINAFSVGHTNHLYTENNENESFTYFAVAEHPDDITVPQCYQGDPDCPEPFNFEMFALNTGEEINFESCGDIGNIYTPEPPNPPCTDCGWSEGFFFGNQDETALSTAINAKIIPGTIGFSVKDKTLQKEFSALLQGYSFRDDLEGLKIYLDNFGDYFLPIKQNIAMQQRDYLLADSLLNQIATYAGYESFVLAQKTYLHWVQDNTDLPNSEELNMLRTYANQDQPMSAFPRSVLNILYHEKFEPSLPDVPGIERETKEKEEITIKNWVYPNPVEEHLYIVATDKIKGQRLVKIVNALGQIVWEENIGEGEHLKVNTTNWTKGIYLIELTNARQERYVEKVIKY